MKVLFWTKEIEIMDAGGPAGYCYNIKNFLERNPCDEIDFYPSKKENDVKSKIRQWITKHKCIYFFIAVYWEYFKKSPLSSDDQKLLSKYDYVLCKLFAMDVCMKCAKSQFDINEAFTKLQMIYKG